MKINYNFIVVACIIATSVFTITSCQHDNDDVFGNKTETGLEQRANNNSILYAPSAHPFGKSLGEWGQLFCSTVYTLDCAGLDINQMFTLDENVVGPFLLLSEGGMDITMTKDQVLFMPTLFYVNDYPCPDPAFEPSEDQTLEEFLQDGIGPYIDVVETLEVSLDGVDLGDIIGNYRIISDLYYFTGNPDLASCFDPCITGDPQAGVAAGFFIMFKKMGVGEHTIVVHGEMPDYEFEWDLTFNITVE